MADLITRTTSTAPDAAVVDLCAALIRFDTTNRGQGDCEGEREAAEFVAGELVAAGLEPVLLESAPRRANVIARVPGTDPTLPAVLVQGHLDVVPAAAEDWSVPPFAGEILDGYLWGRGAVDMKDLCSMTLSVLRSWAATGVRPRRDVVVAFVADEEDNGDYGADWLVTHHPDLFDGCAAAIGESGGFTFGNPGSPVRLYPIGTAERGTLHLRLTATGRAGHASRPNQANAVTALARTLARIADHPWPLRLTPAVKAYLQGAAQALDIPTNPSTMDSSIDDLIHHLGRAGTLAAATVRVSSTPTVLSAGGKVNVIPSNATALVDIRTLPGTTEEVLSTVDSLLEPGVTYDFLARRDAVAAVQDSAWFDAMADALRTEDPDAVVLPYCLGGGTDAKAFASLGIQCYGFAPLLLPTDPTEYDYRAMAHGVDERVPLDALRFGARVLDHFLRTV